MYPPKYFPNSANQNDILHLGVIMCSFCFCQRDHSLRWHVSISTINSLEGTRVCLYCVYVCVCMRSQRRPQTNPTPALLREATELQKKTRSFGGEEEPFLMKLYPAKKERGGREWQKREKSNCRLETTAALEFYGKILQKGCFHKRQTLFSLASWDDKTKTFDVF